MYCVAYMSFHDNVLKQVVIDGAVDEVHAAYQATKPEVNEDLSYDDFRAEMGIQHHGDYLDHEGDVMTELEYLSMRYFEMDMVLSVIRI